MDLHLGNEGGVCSNQPLDDWEFISDMHKEKHGLEECGSGSGGSRRLLANSPKTLEEACCCDESTWLGDCTAAGDSAGLDTERGSAYMVMCAVEVCSGGQATSSAAAYGSIEVYQSQLMAPPPPPSPPPSPPPPFPPPASPSPPPYPVSTEFEDNVGALAGVIIGSIVFVCCCGGWIYHYTHHGIHLHLKDVLGEHHAMHRLHRTHSSTHNFMVTGEHPSKLKWQHSIRSLVSHTVNLQKENDELKTLISHPETAVDIENIKLEGKPL
jgi:hypothetical protein